VLTIRAMTGGAGYAERHLEHSDYYDEHRRVQDEWRGRCAELLGLSMPALPWMPRDSAFSRVGYVGPLCVI
jgi:hypothetical protein